MMLSVLTLIPKWKYPLVNLFALLSNPHILVEIFKYFMTKPNYITVEKIEENEINY